MKKEKAHNVIYEFNQLMRNKNFIGARIGFVLIDKQDEKNSIGLMTDNNEELYEIHLKRQEIKKCKKWAYDIVEYVCECLSKDYEIGFMNMQMHYMIWNTVEDVGIDNIHCIFGLQKYLKYCKENNINKQQLDNQGNLFEVTDIMKYYNEKTDYIKIETGENLADIFKNKEEERVMEDNTSELQFYDEKEIRNIITNKEKLYFADDGIDEVIIKFEDIPDFIVDINRKQGTVDLKFYKMGNDVYEPDITTMGEYLDKVKPKIREKIIDRLVKLQTGEIEPKEYKLIDENEFEDIKTKMEKEMSRKVKNKKKSREDR